jgi:hypothetical protein
MAVDCVELSGVALLVGVGEIFVFLDNCQREFSYVKKIGRSYLPLTRAHGIPLSLQELSCIRKLNVLEVSAVLALGIELKEGVRWPFDLPVIFDCTEAVARSPGLFAIC